MAICEQCGKEHEGTFGSGRFCCRSCSNKWVALNQSPEAKARKVEKGKKNLNPPGKRRSGCSAEGYWTDERRKAFSEHMTALNTEKCRERLVDTVEGRHTYYVGNRLLEYLVFYGIKEWKCERCGLTEWLGSKINLELHHKNGEHEDNLLDNLEALCPNCHSFTENYKWKKRFNKLP